VRIRTRGSFFIRAGNIGYLVPYISQKTKAIKNAAPIRRGARTCADFHGYY
jgi:hypothetical protein